MTAVDELSKREMVEIEEGETSWRFDAGFLRSNWSCIWGRGCLGILPSPTPELGHGCCSIGADLDDEDEARLLSALAATLEPALFEKREVALAEGIFADDSRKSTRVVDGACIFYNRSGFPGGEGCALHLAAVAEGEPPRDWKPAVCWQLPVKVVWEARSDGGEVATMRAWSRADWGAEGETMAWCCTEGELAYVGEQPVVESLAEEIEAITGTAVYLKLRDRLREP